MEERYSLSEIAEALDVPFLTDAELLKTDFRRGSIGRVHDWRNYCKHLSWKTMTPLERFVSYAEAVHTADNEEWD